MIRATAVEGVAGPCGCRIRHTVWHIWPRIVDAAPQSVQGMRRRLVWQGLEPVLPVEGSCQGVLGAYELRMDTTNLLCRKKKATKVVA